jgi:hypothetical protein
MTAEVAAMNRSAVALAADSKVTVTSPRGDKTYDTVNKVFALSKIHPVGVMIYGNASFMGYPWETVVKEYRRAIRDKCKDTIEEWDEDFTDFVQKFGDITDDVIGTNIGSILTSWLQWAWESADVKAREAGAQYGTHDYYDVLADIIQIETGSLSEQIVKGDQTVIAESLSKFSEQIRNAIHQWGMSEAKSSNKRLSDIAMRFCIAALLTEEPSPNTSGVVLAGFGDKELFPSIHLREIDGHIGYRFKQNKKMDSKITHDNKSCVVPFAQRDMVERFMEGMDPGYGDFLQGLIEEVVTDSCLTVLDKYGKSKSKTNVVRNEIRTAIQSRIEDVRSRATQYRRDEFVTPVVEMVAMLPKDELANLAESLVALTSLRARVSHGLATVGGAVDVAVISKGDGFVWVKRKHYFPPELNVQFLRNYMHGVHIGDSDNDE